MTAEHGLYIPPDPNITRFSTGHHVQQTEVHDGFLVVNDPQLGSYIIGNNNANNIYYDLFTTDDNYRSIGVSQLSKRDFFATIPNTGDFTRYWHGMGLFRLVDHFSHTQKVDSERQLAYTLYGALPDRGHADFAHAIEPPMQHYLPFEDWHEKLWPHVGEVGGTEEVLTKHGVKHTKSFTIPGVDIPRWVECSAPDINIDRFQYTVTELLLWFDHDQSPPEVRELVRTICSPDNLTITDDGDFAFKDIEVARIFSKGYLLLTTEHWNDPINRVQLHLLVETAKRAVTKRRIAWMDEVDKGVTRRPDQYFFGTEQDIVDAMQTGPRNRDDFMYAVKNLLYPIAMQERERFTNYKLSEYGAFLLDSRAHDYPSELLEPRRVEFGPPSSQVSIGIEYREDAMTPGARMPKLRSGKGICYDLYPLKNRYVDPKVVHKGKVVRLSEVDGNYKNLLDEQQKVRGASVIVRLALAGDFEQAFKEGIKENQLAFNRLLDISTTPEMTLDQKRQVIHLGAQQAVRAAVDTGTLVFKKAA